MSKTFAITVSILFTIVFVSVGVAWYWAKLPRQDFRLNAVAIKRGNLVASVMATGTIEPEELVDVGAQVGGIIIDFGRDPQNTRKTIDFLSKVQEGTILARIDDSIYRARLDKSDAQVRQAEAQVDLNKASVRSAEADVVQMKSKSHQADREWSRAQQLLPTKAISDEEYDVAQTNFEVGRSNIAVAEAAVDQARANLSLSERSLLVMQADRREAQRNLDYTVIKSPVNGIIIDRRVNVGQTVVSSLNAPSLFLIAKDLRRLQLWASVNEADVGRLTPGQGVRFTVDAFPDEQFIGEVSQIRLNATMTQNVVTYTVVVTTDNSNGKLIPYLTANLEFEVGRRQNVLLVPNSALRWQPRPEQISAELRADIAKPGQQATAVGRPGDAGKHPHDHGRVWRDVGGYVRPVDVKLGLSNGVLTEVTGDDLKEDDLLVTGETPAGTTPSAASPFSPRMFTSGRK